jgi:hypothetical protein
MATGRFAHLVLFLASDEAGCTTGQQIGVDARVASEVPERPVLDGSGSDLERKVLRLLLGGGREDRLGLGHAVTFDHLREAAGIEGADERRDGLGQLQHERWAQAVTAHPDAPLRDRHLPHRDLGPDDGMKIPGNGAIGGLTWDAHYPVGHQMLSHRVR